MGQIPKVYERSEMVKKTTDNLILLNGIFMLGLILSNLFGGKLISICGMTVAGAVLTYPLTFLTTDIIGEIWGKRAANQCVKTGVIIQLAFLFLGFLSLEIPALPQSAVLQQSLDTALNQGARMTLASLGAFLCSQFLDVFIFHKLREKTNGCHKWLRNNVGTMTSQMIDTAVFVTIAFWGVVPDLPLMVVSQYIVKFFLALLDTPFFYFFTRKRKDMPSEAA